MKRATSLLFAMFLLSAYLWGQGTTGSLSGYVIEAVQGPIASVRVFSGTYEAFTNTAGFYLIGNIEAGSYDVGFEKTGYISKTVQGVQIIADQTTNLDKTLEFTPPVLNSATVFQYSVSLQFTGNPVLVQYGLPMMAGFQGGSPLDEIPEYPLNYDPAGDETLEDELPGDQSITTPPSVNPVYAPTAVGDNCNDPIVITSFPYANTNTTCGKLDDYNATCLDLFDQGEDIVYKFVLTAPKKIVATLSGVATNRRAGMLITAECPIGNNCIASIGNNNASKTLTVNLEPGTYYIMIDNRTTSFPCINTFNLSVTAEDPTPGSMCSLAVTALLGNNIMPITTNSTTFYWWEYTPTEDCSITINTCLESNVPGYKMSYDLLAYDGCGGNLVASQYFNANSIAGGYFCNIDFPYTTTLVFNAQAGVSIKFRWGNGTATANFTLETGPVILPVCPPDAIPEPELCGENLNGGCYGSGGVFYGDDAFTPIAIGDKFCGKEYTLAGNTRDNDYYKLVITEAKTLTWSVTAQFPVHIFIADGNSGCPGIANPNYILQRAFALPGQTATLTRTVLPGTYWLCVAVVGWSQGYPCNGFQANRYVAELTGVYADVPYIKIYRDNVYVGKSYFSTFTDQMVPPGAHCYTVSHYFPGGETQMSNEICVDVLDPAELNVSPASLSETLAVGATSTQVLNISNTGDTPMDWNAFLGFQNITTSPVMVPSDKLMVPAGQPGIIKADFTIKNSVSGGEPGLLDASIFTLHYDWSTSIGVGSDSGPWIVAARYPPPMVSQYTGFSLVSVDVYLLQAPSSTILRIWGQGTTTSPGAMIYQQAFTPTTIPGWNTVTLTTPLPVNGTDIWVGYKLTHDPSLMPAGADAGPANIDGEWVSLDDGASWNRISALAPDFNFNWNIRANVSSEIYNWLTITPSSGTVLSGQSTDVTVTFNASGLLADNYNAYINVSNFGQWNGNTKPVPVVLSVTEHLTWTGATDNDWNKPTNWSPEGVPFTNTSVTIPKVTNDPVIYQPVSDAARCFDLTIQPSALLTINPGMALTVNGSLTNSSGNTGLVVKSGGSLIESTTGVAAIFETDIVGGEWHLISSPVSNATANMFLGLYLQEHTESTNVYTDIIEPSTPLNVMQGYALWNDLAGTAQFAGTLNTGAIGSANNVTRSGEGWNLAGNPYASSIDWDASTGWTKTYVNNATYRHVNSATWASYVGGVGANGATRYIAPCQGFFVEVTNGQIFGTLSMDNDVRTHSTSPFFKDEVSDIVRIEVSGNGYTDETVIRFLDIATPEFDGQWDAHKLFGTVAEAPAIYTSDNGMMAINSLPATNSVPLGVKAGVPGEFTITATETSEFADIILEDLLTGVITDLKSNSNTFNYDMSFDNRFIVHFTPLAVGENPNELINIYSSQKDVYVSVPANTKGDIVIYNLMGQEVARTMITDVLNKITLEKSAYYVVKVMSNESVVTKKVFVK